MRPRLYDLEIRVSITNDLEGLFALVSFSPKPFDVGFRAHMQGVSMPVITERSNGPIVRTTMEVLNESNV